MESKKSFLHAASFNVYLNIASGLWMSNLTEISSRPFIRAALHMFSILSDMFIMLHLLTISIPLFSPTVPIAERCIGTFITIIIFQAMLKSLHFTLYRKEIQAFMEHWENSFSGGPFKEEEEQLLSEERRFVKLLSIIFVNLMAVPPFFWCFSAFVPFIQDLHGGRFVPIPAYFPFDALKSPMFELIILYQSISAWFAVSKSLAFDQFFFTLASLQVAQLRYLNTRMKNMFRICKEISESDTELAVVEKDVLSTDRRKGNPPSDSSNELALEVEDLLAHYQPTKTKQLSEEPGLSRSHVVSEQRSGISSPRSLSEPEEMLRTEIRLWVIHHQESINLLHELDRIYSPIIFVQLLTTILILCFSAFVAKEVTTLDIWQYQSASINVIGHMAVMFYWCYYGDRVAEESALLAISGMANGWNTCRDKQVLNSLKIIALRSQIPHQMSALGVFRLGAVTFLEVTRLAISYLLVLIDLKEKT